MMQADTIRFIILVFASFAAGSIPFGVIITRAFYSKDVRSSGSGNIGATNVTRVAGKLAGTATLALDLAKGALPVYVAGVLFPGKVEPAMALAGFAAVAGHSYPLFSGFKGGGKGVATAAGAFLVMAPGACLAALAIFIAVTASFRRVSAGSLSAAVCLPLATLLIYGAGAVLAASVATCALVVARHRQNIKRLLKGTEPPFF